jgi:hypothetical protein
MRKMQIILIVFLFLFSGCNKEFRTLSKSRSTKQSAYAAADSVHLENYILYNTVSHLSFTRNNKPMPIDKDSVMEVVGESFKKLEVSFVDNFHLGDNHIDSIFYQNQVIKIKHIDKNWIKEVAGDTKGRKVLVPFIYIFNRITFTGYITSGGMAGSSGYHLMTFLNLMVFIVEDDDIVYSGQTLHTSERTWANSREEAEAIPPAPLVRQEHWDELVRLAMKDYIKRVK